MLQNSLEQTVLAFGAHLILATMLRAPELVIIRLLVAQRDALSAWRSQRHRPRPASYLLAAGLMIAGR